MMLSRTTLLLEVLKKSTPLVFPPISFSLTRFSLLLPSNPMPKSTFPLA